MLAAAAEALLRASAQPGSAQQPWIAMIYSLCASCEQQPQLASGGMCGVNILEYFVRRRCCCCCCCYWT